MKKGLSLLFAGFLFLCALAGCKGADAAAPRSEEAGPTTPATAQPGTANFDGSVPITVVSREDGSGTRGAFVELLGIEEKQDDGTKLDRTTLDAVTVNSTSVVMATVAGDPYAIGYISLGSLNDSVRAVEIDGVAATAENVANGSYAAARPFNIATAADVSAVAQDFIDFILSAEGQAVVADNGYIPLEGAPAYSGSKPAGKVVAAGSSSVTPVMEKLKEAYLALNPNAEIEIQQSDSTTGMNAAIDSICDIGMASRELKDSELEAGLAATVIAMDGIAVIVNKQNPVAGLTGEQVRNIYTGEVPTWGYLA